MGHPPLGESKHLANPRTMEHHFWVARAMVDHPGISIEIAIDDLKNYRIFRHKKIWRSESQKYLGVHINCTPFVPQRAGSWLFPHMVISWVLTQPHVSSCIPIISQPLLIAFHPAMRTSSPGLRLWSLWWKLRQMSSQAIRFHKGIPSATSNG